MNKVNKMLSMAIVCCMLLMATVVSAQESQIKNFQLGFITPIGTNGTQSHLFTNKVSVNMLGGYSYGNIGLEFSSLYNVNTHITKGFQFTGIANYSGNAENAMQFAGISNVAIDGVIATQFGGVINVAKEVKGGQFAGISNAAKEVQGMQIAGVINAAKEVDGVQIAGVVNICTDTVTVQIGGVLNIAKKVKGTQIGLVNYAEENDGLSIGLINIVKKGGKREFEVSLSEAINTAISFKLGTDDFYTIFSVGINYMGTSSTEYAYGIGLGTNMDWKEGWESQIELMSYSLTEEGKWRGDMNQLYQLKFTVSKQVAERFKVFAGPVLNLTVSDYVNPKTGELGCSLAPWSMWKNDSKTTRLNSWIGFSAGVRF